MGDWAEAATRDAAAATADAADVRRRADVAEQRANDADQLRSRADERVEDYRGHLEPREADQLPVPTPTLIAAAGPALRARRGAPG